MIRDTSRLKQALIDGMIQKAEREIQHISVSLPVEADHRYRFLNRVHTHKKEMPMSKRVAIVLIAALLILLTSCAIVYRHEIAGFFVNLFDGRAVISLTKPEEGLREIEEIKLPSHIAEGYELVYDVKYISFAERRWENAEGDTIILKQGVPGQRNFGFDTDRGTYEFLQIGNMNIYCHHWETGKYIYIWENHYIYKLTCPYPLSGECLKKIIENTT